MKARAFTLVLALGAIATPALAVRAFVSPTPPRVPTPPTTSRVGSSVLPVDITTLPVGEVRALEPSSNGVPADVPADAEVAKEIVIGADASLRKPMKKRLFGSVQLWAATGPGVLAFLQPQSQSDMLPFPLGYTQTYDCSRSAGPQAVRWETFGVDAAGAGTLVVSDGAVTDCAVRVLHRSTVHFAAIASFDGIGLAFAAKHEGGITVLFPADAEVSADTGGAAPTLGHGAVWRVELPIGKGLSASAVGHIPSTTVDRFADEMTGKQRDRAAPRNDVTIGVEVSQTIDEDEPSVVARLRSQ